MNTRIRVWKIISGGQTGGDQGGLVAGKKLKLVTGGTAPKLWRTETGSDERLEEFGLVQSKSHEYRPRTIQNVKDSDGTVVFGNVSSPGCRLTINWCTKLSKPVFLVHWKSGEPLPDTLSTDLFRRWLIENDIGVLNVAGNRESSQPGIGRMTVSFLVGALTPPT